jgi:hypothetical protein
MIVCEREDRFGTARGPPGTVGVLEILTGRGLGATNLAGAFWSLAEGRGALPDSFVLTLAFLPSEEKKLAGDLADFGELTNRIEDADESEVLAEDWEAVIGDGSTKDGYGRAGGP